MKIGYVISRDNFVSFSIDRFVIFLLCYYLNNYLCSLILAPACYE